MNRLTPDQIIGAFNAIMGMGNPQSVYNDLYQSNPNFRSFADQLQGKTPEQMLSQFGMDFNQVRNLLGR